MVGLGKVFCIFVFFHFGCACRLVSDTFGLVDWHQIVCYIVQLFCR